jgi:hypothetical protein
MIGCITDESNSIHYETRKKKFGGSTTYPTLQSPLLVINKGTGNLVGFDDRLS